MPSADAPLNLAPSRIASLWPALVSLVVVVAAFVTLQNDVRGAQGAVATAQTRADAAYSKAERAEAAMGDMRERLARIETILNRIERSIK